MPREARRAAHHPGVQRRSRIAPGAALAGARARLRSRHAVDQPRPGNLSSSRSGELALELGATAAQVHRSPRDVPRGLRLSGAAGRRGLSAELLSRLGAGPLRDRPGAGAAWPTKRAATTVAHAAASKGNDQVRMETAIAAQDPKLRVLAPVREWNLKNLAKTSSTTPANAACRSRSPGQPGRRRSQPLGREPLLPRAGRLLAGAAGRAFVLTRPAELAPERAGRSSPSASRPACRPASTASGWSRSRWCAS